MWYFCSSLWLALSTQALKEALECALVLYIFQKHSLKDREFSEKLGLPLELLQLILSACWNTDILSANPRLRSILRVKGIFWTISPVWVDVIWNVWWRVKTVLVLVDGRKGKPNNTRTNSSCLRLSSQRRPCFIALKNLDILLLIAQSGQLFHFFHSIFAGNTIFPKTILQSDNNFLCGSFRTFSRNHTDAGLHVTLAPN